MSAIFERGPALATRAGDTLTATLSYGGKGKNVTERVWRRSQLDPALAAWFDDAAEGGEVEVVAAVDGNGQLVQVRLAHPPLFIVPKPDQARLDAVTKFHGGGVNPYTFIPTPARDGLPPELDNARPAPHGVVDPATEWSGWLGLRLVARTPLLLPDPEAVQVDPVTKHHTYPVRQADGAPLLHGASVKGALRSAYETVTGSRYGVFRGHDRPLAYRRAAGRVDVVPARVESNGAGQLVFPAVQEARDRGAAVRSAAATGP